MQRYYPVLFFIFLLYCRCETFSQNIGINTTGSSAVASAMLDIDASPGNNKGLLIPRITAAEKTAIASPANGLLIYQTDAPLGFWYYDATIPAWVQLGTAGGSGWSLSGNALTGGTSATPNEFIGSTNNYDWVVKTNNTEKLRVTSAGYLGIGTSISAPTQLLHIASNSGNTAIRYETQNVTTSITPSYTTSAGPNYATVAVDDASIGLVTWGTPGNGTSSNNSWAITGNMTNTVAATPSHYLKETGFGFAIPATATILGIVIDWEKDVGVTTGTSALDNAVRIVKGGVIGTTDKSSATQWSTTEAFVSHGTGTTDLWGLTWTPTDINDPTFGAAISVKNNTGTIRTFSVDACRATVYYSMPAVPNLTTVNWSVGTDYSDVGKFKISNASTLSSSTFLTVDATGNVGVGTASPNASALLDLTATTKGFLMPRIALTGTSSALPTTSPATSLLVYNTATVSDVVPGHYYWDGTKWVVFGGSGWLLTGNANTVSTNFLGTTELDLAHPIRFKVNGQVSGIIDGNGPTFFGYQAGKVNTYATNTGYGYQALMNNAGVINEAENTAVGYQALMANNGANGACVGNSGFGNVAVGHQAMLNNICGHENVALGRSALKTNNSNYNTAVGFSALANSTSASNTAIGWISQEQITTGTNNSTLGAGALSTGATGTDNVVIGVSAMTAATGSGNVAIGNYALKNTSSGSNNIAIGTYDIACCTYNGVGKTITTGSNNIFIGYQADAGANNLTNATAIGNGAIVAASNTMKFGNASITDNYFTGNVRATCGILVCSDLRYKKEIQPISYALSRILKMQPVTYYLKTGQELSTDGVSSTAFTGSNTHEKQIGFIAQEMELVFPEVVHTDHEGYKSLDYSRLTPLLVAAMKEQQQMIDSLSANNLNLKSGFGSLRENNKKLHAEFSALRSEYDKRMEKIEELLGTKPRK